MAENFAEEHRNVIYNNNVTFELRAKPGILYPLVGMTKSYAGAKSARIENRFDELEMEETAGRNSDTNNVDVDSLTRHIKVGKSQNVAPLLDGDDIDVTQVDLKSPLVMGVAKAARRYHDDIWLRGYFGSGYTGETGEVAVPFTPANKVDHGGVGLTLAKLISMQEKMQLADVDIEEEEPIMLLTPRQQSDLLNITEYKSADFNDQKPLVRGEMKPWMGFRFVRFNPDSPKAYKVGGPLTKSGTTRSLPCFVPSGLHRGVWNEFWGKIDPRPDKEYSTQIFAKARSAVVRTDEAKCWLMECTEA